jgi:hypothetical protein
MMSERLRGQLTHANALAYLLAGDATVTIVNERTGNRFTFEVKAPKEDREGRPLSPEQARLHFVRVLIGPDNTSQYAYLGLIRDRASYEHGRKSRITPDASSARVMSWVFPRLVAGTLPEHIRIYHEGSCGRCGRKLTVPESVERGLGPECAQRRESKEAA